MPPAPTQLRVLQEEFRSFVESSDLWPAYKKVENFFNNEELGYNRSLFVAMKRGKPVPEKYVTALVALLRDKPMMKEYLASKADGGKAGQSIPAIVELLTESPVARPALTVHLSDWFMRGLDGLVSLFTDFFWGELVRKGTICRTEDDVAKAVDMILIASGHYLAQPGEMLSDEEAVRLVEAITKISRQDYLEKVVESWRFASWSIAFAVIDRARVACSRVLPLTETVYEDIRSGQRSIDDCTIQDFVLPSRSLFIDAIGEKSESEYPHVDKRSKQQLRTLFLQFAYLSYNEHARQPLRILSLAGTPTYMKRAKKLGFRSVGACMHGTDIAIYEMNVREATFIPMIIKELQRRLFTPAESL